MSAELVRTAMMIPLTLLLGASFSVWPLAPAAALELPPCELVNMTLSLEKDGCPRCHLVETTICSGHCRTKEPSIIFPHLKVNQHVCTYRELHYRTVQLPDCPAGVDPSVSYPEALSCHCNLCVTNMADCIRHEYQEPDVCVNDLPFHF